MNHNNHILPGYKQSPLGLIPDDWEVKELGKLSEKIGSGITPTGGEAVYKESGRYFLRSQNIGWGSLLLDDVAFIDDETHSTFKSTEIKEQDVFLNITGASIGRSAIANNGVIGGNVNQHVCIIRTKKNELYPYYLNAFLLSQTGQNLIDSYQAGGNRQGLNFEQIKSFKILLPPLPEQTAIANLLSTWDKVIQTTTQLIAQKEQRKKWLMQQLLTGKKRLKGFSGKWKEYKIDEVFDFVKSYSYSRDNLTYDNSEGSIYYIHYGDIHAVFENDILDLREKVKVPFLKKEFGNEFTFLKDGDIIIADASEDYKGVGESVEIENIDSKKVIAGLHTLVLRDNHNLTAKVFRGFLFNGEPILNSLRKVATGISVYGISKSGLAAIKILIPSLEEQTAIAFVLHAADKEIQLLKTKAEQLKEQKKGLMQQLLTGKKRLKISKN